MEENSRKVLSAPKIKFTNQRALILEIIHHGEGHLDADEVYRRARDKQPRLSLSTVYRTLRRFKELGLIEEVHFDEAHHHYEVKPLAEHHHLLCLGCGRIIEFHYPLSRYVKRNVPEARGFRVVETEIRMTGYCPGCRQDKK
ncbi:MAG: transcriptional repressor [Dehalococcoidales bacterium]|nr:transcriptional repressor [Dehalococcoidales bacterium]